MSARTMILIMILLGVILMSKNAFAIDSEIKEFIGCNVIEEDPDFLINITNCNETFVSGELTFNPETSKNTLTGWFNLSGDYVSSNQYTIRKSNLPSIPFALYLKDFNPDVSKINLILKWGLSTSTVSVTQNTVYRVSGNDGTYSMDFQKTNCGISAPCGGETNMTVYGTNMPSYRPYKNFTDATYQQGIDYSNHSLIESGGARVLIVSENKTNNFYIGSTKLNWTGYVYAYPTYYQHYYTATANNSFGYGSLSVQQGFQVYQTSPQATDNPRFEVWNNRTEDGNTYSYSVNVSTGADTINLGINSVAFWYDGAAHNKSVLLYTTFSTLSTVEKYGYQDSTERTRLSYSTNTGSGAGTRDLGWLVMFGQSGATTVANNETVWNNDFEEQYRAWYNPATMTAIIGTQKARNNITGSYNFSANGTMADFNFTTVAGMNYTYPVFEIENISNTSAIKVFWKNYTASSSWVLLNNYTDYVIQEGNKTFFGYDYVVLLINKTLGRETANAETYEFMVNNTTGAAPPPGNWYNLTGNYTLSFLIDKYRRGLFNRTDSLSFILTSNSYRRTILNRLGTLAMTLTPTAYLAVSKFYSYLSPLALTFTSASYRRAILNRLDSLSLTFTSTTYKTLLRIYSFTSSLALSFTLNAYASVQTIYSYLSQLSLTFTSSSYRTALLNRLDSLSITFTSNAYSIVTKIYSFTSSLMMTFVSAAQVDVIPYAGTIYSYVSNLFLDWSATVKTYLNHYVWEEIGAKAKYICPKIGNFWFCIKVS